jgi:3-oxoadipate enol-lactonase
MPIISTKNLNIYFERSPDRDYEPLLYIGGTAGDLRNKPNQMDSPLTNFFEVISYDQRGLGQTEVPSGEYSMQQYAHDAANLLDALKIESINVLAYRLAEWLRKN